MSMNKICPVCKSNLIEIPQSFMVNGFQSFKFKCSKFEFSDNPMAENSHYIMKYSTSFEIDQKTIKHSLFYGDFVFDIYPYYNRTYYYKFAIESSDFHKIHTFSVAIMPCPNYLEKIQSLLVYS